MPELSSGCCPTSVTSAARGRIPGVAQGGARASFESGSSEYTPTRSDRGSARSPAPARRQSVISIIIPTLSEAAGILPVLTSLAHARRRRHVEVIVVDGGSNDGTLDLARPLADRVLSSPRGRASQMNAGAEVAAGEMLLFLHADTRLPIETLQQLPAQLCRSGKAWGRFDVTIEGTHPMLRVIAWAMNRRSRLTGIATGDQAMFVRREAFDRCGHFPDIPLMEDIALSRRLKRESPPLCVAERATTSGRRWEQHRVLRTIALMWLLRLLYFAGVDPARLSRLYSPAPHHGRTRTWVRLHRGPRPPETGLTLD